MTAREQRRGREREAKGRREGGKEEKGKKKEKNTCIIKENKTHAHVNNVHIVYICYL